VPVSDRAHGLGELLEILGILAFKVTAEHTRQPPKKPHLKRCSIQIRIEPTSSILAEGLRVKDYEKAAVLQVDAA
jgi:hypothetical protein